MGRLALLALAAVLSGCAALKAQVTLVEGLRQFDAGEHEKSAATLQSAVEIGLGDKDRATAYKHLAFIHCSAGRERACRDEFRKALAADPATQLDAAEAGHPVWGPIFRSMSGASALTTMVSWISDGAICSESVTC